MLSFKGPFLKELMTVLYGPEVDRPFGPKMAGKRSKISGR